MKNTFRKALMLIAAFVSVSCMDEIENPATENPLEGDLAEMTFTASFAGDTRTTLVNGVEVWWQPDDQIIVTNGEECNNYYTTITAPAKEAEFKGFGGNLSAKNGFYYAGFPTYSFEGTVFNAFCPAYQNAVPNSFASNVNVAVAKCPAEERLFTFRNVFGYLKFDVSEDCEWDIVSVEVRAKGGEALSGSCKIDCSEDDPQIERVQDAGFDYVSLNSEQALTPGSYYIAVLPGKYEEGLEFNIISADGKVSVKSIDREMTIRKGVIYSLGTITSLNDYMTLQKEALMALYESTGGDSWDVNTNWGSDNPLYTWYGVMTDEKGFVYYLSLSGNNLKGTLPAEIGNLKYLKKLYLNSNELEGDIPQELYGLSGLSELSLSSNQLTGTLSPSIGNLAQLKTLDLGYNRFSGSLPEEIGDLTGLQTLSLGHNEFTGQIPSSFSGLTELISLVLENNSFSGNIDFISSLVNLGTVALRENGFSGSLPDGIGALKNVRQFDIEKNDFNGAVPAGISEIMTTIDKYHLAMDGNALTGKLPADIYEHPRFEEFWPTILNQDIEKGGGIDISDLRIPAPSGTYTDIDGNTIDLYDFYSSNELTIWLNWAAWCPFSLDMIQYLIPIYNAYKSKGLGILGYDAMADVWPLDTMEDMETSIAKNQIPWRNIPMYESGGDERINYHTALFSFVLPEIMVVDQSGAVILQMRTKYEDYNNIEEALTALLAKELGNVELEKPDLYESEDMSKDGEVVRLQYHTKGDGIDVVLLGDGFVDLDMEADGVYESLMKEAMEALFEEEPMSSHREYFNVYTVKAVSKHNIISESTSTVFDTEFGAGTRVSGDNDKCFTYASEVNDYKAIYEDGDVIDLTKSIVICLMNQRYYAGTCYMFTDGSNVSYFPLGYDDEMFVQLLNHEAVGHGFGKLMDEYEDNIGRIPLEEANSFNMNAIDYGWGENVDINSDPAYVKWSMFLSDPRYQNEGLGVYEGALTYQYGAFRPSMNSIMRYNTGGFNAPSRYAIYKRIMEYAGVGYVTYEDFVEYDEINLTSAVKANAAMKARRNYVERTFEPTHPPVIVKGSWRDAMK